MKTIILDIETEGDQESLNHPPRFTPPENYKKPEVIEKWTAEKRESWAKSLALRAATGRILVGGINDPDGDDNIFEGDEKKIVLELIEWLESAKAEGWIVGGWNHVGFDLPFIYQRACILGVSTRYIYDPFEKWKPWPFRNADGMLIWAAGTKEYSGLNDVARVLGIGCKNNDISANFSEVYHSNREVALDHLHKDLSLTRGVLEKLL